MSLLVPLTPPHSPLGSKEHFQMHKGSSALELCDPVPFSVPGSFVIAAACSCYKQ